MYHKDISDEKLIKDFQNGNREAFTHLMNRYKDRITNFIFRFTGDMTSAEDLAQDTFFRLYKNKKQ